MGNSQVEKYLDEGLEGKFFEGLPAPDYLNKDFSDKELDGLSKQDLINIITKAVVLVCIGERELRDEKNKRELLMKERDVFNRKILSNYEVKPGLISVCSDEYQIEFAIENDRLEKLKLAKDFIELIRKIPEIKVKAKSTIPSSGGKGRAGRDERTKALKIIEEAEYPKVIHLMHLYGRVTFYAREWLNKYSDYGLVSEANLRRFITDLNNKNNIKLNQKFTPKINFDA